MRLQASGKFISASAPGVYRRLVHPRPWLNHALLGFSIFAALNVALPLVGVRPIMALEGSAVLVSGQHNAAGGIQPDATNRGEPAAIDQLNEHRADVVYCHYF